VRVPSHTSKAFALQSAARPISLRLSQAEATSISTAPHAIVVREFHCVSARHRNCVNAALRDRLSSDSHDRRARAPAIGRTTSWELPARTPFNGRGVTTNGDTTRIDVLRNCDLTAESQCLDASRRFRLTIRRLPTYRSEEASERSASSRLSGGMSSRPIVLR
jgi:hypothetical protein